MFPKHSDLVVLKTKNRRKVSPEEIHHAYVSCSECA